MMYAQQLEYLKYNIEDLIKLIEEKIVPEKWALIEHDRDVDDTGRQEAAHIHCMMTFKNARSISSVAKLLGDKPQYLQAWNKNIENGFSYLIHATESSRGKYRYSVNEVRANFDYRTLVEKVAKQIGKSRERVQVNDVMNSLYDGKMTLGQAEDALTGAQYARVSRQLESVYLKRLQKEAEAWHARMRAENRLVEVIWLYGESSMGKTSLAIDIARSRNVSFFVTGSSRDIFQGYDGSHTIIIDELRPKCLGYSDLLRITDPHALTNGGVMLPSRFKDIPLAADLILITTPLDPYSFYRNEVGINTQDSFKQLERRITLAVEMRVDGIYQAKYQSADAGYVILRDSFMFNGYSSIGRSAGKSGNSTVNTFNRFFDIGCQQSIEEVGCR